jgi:C4-dicarboxylate-binding protein DctP
VQKHLTVTNHGYVGYLIAVNSSFWDGLPDDIRAELEVIVDEVSAWANQRAKSINEEALNKIIASENSEITYLTAEQLKVWQEKMRPVWDEFSDKIGADLISAAQKTSN